MYNLLYKPVIALIALLIKVAVFIRFPFSLSLRVKHTNAEYAQVRVIHSVTRALGIERI